MKPYKKIGEKNYYYLGFCDCKKDMIFTNENTSLN